MKMHTTRGYTMLISVLVLSAVSTALVLAVFSLGLTTSKISFDTEQGTQARALADACAEEALEQIRANTSFTGIGSLMLGQGSCSYSVSDGGGENRTVQASSTISVVNKKVLLTITQLTPTTTISSWQEVGDF